MITLADIFQAYYDCRRNKSNTREAIEFELDYEAHLIELYDEIISDRYRVGRSIAFIVDRPCVREVFAGAFRDRIVHHLIYNQINPLFERSFIHDSYSCRVGKGTRYGIDRVTRFMRSCSHNHQIDISVMKLDIA